METTRLQSYSTTNLQLRARAELELRRRGISGVSPFAPYRFDPQRYIREKLGWTPWAGAEGHPGQAEILDAYADALRAQVTTPDAPVKNRIRVEAGHAVGKTMLAAGIVNHFFDCFPPAICYTYAPTWEQIHDLLWKEIKAHRRGKGLPGRILDLELRASDNHFAKGRATSNTEGRGTERAQGQHGPYLLFVLDEAEGVAEYVFDAVDSMTSGGVSIVLLLANPRTRTSRFHRAAASANVASFRLSCIYHPNVLAGREVVPGAVRRAYVEQMIDNGTTRHCEVVRKHDPDQHTFELPWQPGLIYRPDAEFLFRVMGIAPANIADNVFVPPGRYEAATQREPSGRNPTEARLGVDVARYGTDLGTLYACHAGRLWCAEQFAQQDTGAYHRAIRALALDLASQGVTSLHVRVDGGGGFGGGVIDRLNEDEELRRAFVDYYVLEVHFNGTPSDPDAYADLATELYADTAEALQALALDNPPPALEGDLCERKYRWVKVGGVDVKKLEPKEHFKERMKRSPDDGDGAALSAAADRCFDNGSLLLW
jgi:hypothetical protein